MPERKYIYVTTTKTEIYENIEEGEKPYLDFRLNVKGYVPDFDLMKTVLQAYDRHRNALIKNPEKQSMTSKICIEKILAG